MTVSFFWKHMTTKDRLVTAQWVLERNLGWIAAAEIKVGVLLTMDLAMAGGIAAAYTAATTKSQWLYLSITLYALLAAIGLICAAMAINPRTDGPKTSLLYFGRIAEFQASDYIEKFRVISDEDILADWTEQIHRNAEIAKTKHKWVSRAVSWSFFSSIPWALAIALMVKG